MVKYKQMQFVKNLLIAHSKNKYRPHLIRRHGLALCLLLILGTQLIYGVQSRAGGNVLAYATNMSTSGLLNYTNEQRTTAGLPVLTINSKLASAAQDKAQHMVDYGYWDHIAPDGTTPWYFIESAGYGYLVAGENLAYGFDSSLGAVSGWMASPSHRDNILNSAFEEVGFGIANSADFQGNENTIVVAMYGDPPVSTTPVSTAPVSLVSEEEPLPSGEVPSSPAETAEMPVNDHAGLTILTSNVEKRVTNFDAIINGSASWATYTTVMVLSLLSFVYLYRHVVFINAAVARGEQFVVTHPLLESSLIFATLWMLLAASYGAVL